MEHELLIDGGRFCDYDGFVGEFNRAYLAAFGEPPWDGDIGDLSDFLDAAVEVTGGRLTIRWTHSQKSRSDLGQEQMAEFWRRCMASLPVAAFSPGGYQLVYGWNQERLDQAEAGQGRTLFEFLVWQIGGDGDDGVDLKLE